MTAPPDQDAPSAARRPEVLGFAYQAVTAVWRRRVLSAGFLAGVVTLTVLGLMVAPRTYESQAKLFVAIGDESVGLDPTATTSQTLSVLESRETELNSILEVLSSRVILEEIVGVLGTDAILDEGPLPPRPGEEDADGGQPSGRFSLPLPSLSGLVYPVTNAIGLSDSYSEEEKAVRALSSMIETGLTEKSSVITLSVEADSPQLAQRVAEEAIRSFQGKHREVNQIAGSKAFFAEQAEVLKDDFDAAAEALAAARDDLGVVTIEGRRAAIEAQVVTLEADRLDTEKQLSAVEAEIATIRAMLSRMPESEVAETVVGAANSAADDLRKQISTLKVTESQLLLKYTERHPRVVEVRSQIAEAEDRLAALVVDEVQETSRPSPARLQLEIDLLQKQTVADSLRARSTAIGTQLAELAEESKRLNAEEPRLMKLAQNREVAATQYREYALKFEQARVDEARGERAISNVNVFQEPTFQEKPVAPKKPLVLAAGLIFGLLGAVSLPLLLEFAPLVAPVAGELPEDFPFAAKVVREGDGEVTPAEVSTPRAEAAPEPVAAEPVGASVAEAPVEVPR
ncbi:MAG: GNVR domain-containing protein [Planctomycetota bacterium]